MASPAESLTSNLTAAHKMPGVAQNTDPELLAHAVAGRQDDFAELYRRRQGSIYRFVLQMSGSAAMAEDVTQETFLAVLAQEARYDQERGSVAAFLYGIARNMLLRRLERDRRYLPENPEWDEPAFDGDLLLDLTRAESIERVRRAVLTLPAVYREVVVLCDLQEASYEDAAAALECPVGTVRSRLNRARGMLARKLCGTGDASRSEAVRSCE
jgi:RNA polymerase sigma-70 factor (ECF subfamily)